MSLTTSSILLGTILWLSVPLAQAGLVFDQAIIPLSFSDDDAPKLLVVYFKNNEESPTTIQSVTPSCSCVSVVDFKPEIISKGSGFLRLRVRPPLGLLQKVDVAITWVSNGVPTTAFPITIQASKSGFETIPRLLSWERREPPYEKVMKVLVPDNSIIKGVTIHGNLDRFCDFCLRLMPSKDSDVLVLAIRPTNTVKCGQCRVSIITVKKKKPQTTETHDAYACVF